MTVCPYSRCIAPGGSDQQVERGILAVARLTARLEGCSGPLWLSLQHSCALQGIDRLVLNNVRWRASQNARVPEFTDDRSLL